MCDEASLFIFMSTHYSLHTQSHNTMSSAAFAAGLFLGIFIGIILGIDLFWRLQPKHAPSATSDTSGAFDPTAAAAVARRTTYVTGPRIQVVVLGDIGRSPRMQYHAMSIARRGCHVDLIGYLGERL
jgi:hypothetical protein